MSGVDQIETIKVIASLLELELGLDVDVTLPRVFIYNQKWDIPPDDGLFINISFRSQTIYASGLTYGNDPVSGELMEVKTQNVQEMDTIDLFSRDASARQRRFEVVSAFHSTRAQQLCEQYSFKFATLPTSFIDVSQVEASARLNRFQATFSTLRGYVLRNPAPFFDKNLVPPTGRNLVIQP